LISSVEISERDFSINAESSDCFGDVGFGGLDETAGAVFAGDSGVLSPN